MMKKRLVILFSLSQFLLGDYLYAQQAIETLKQQLDAYSGQNLQEKLFVHTDKGFYMTGEIIWFKVYATDAHLNQPLDLSKLSYVELLNRDHKPVLQAKIAMTDGSGNSSFLLPYSVNSGTYILRAYTNWMKNGSADGFFERNITIVNPLRKPDWPAADAPAEYDVQFFPEGGNLVNGIRSKIAFRIVDRYGKSMDGSGVIVNQRNDTAGKFSTFRFGMGHFDLTPVAGDQYRALIKTVTGTSMTKPLPAASVSGMVMRLYEVGKDRLGITIQSNTAGPAVSLLVHSRQLLTLALSKALVNGKAEMTIDKKQLGEGISHFTVFNAANQPVCERLYFKKPENALSVSIRPDAQTYATRKQVKIDLSTGDAKAQPVAGNLSMSVYLLDSLQAMETMDIRAYLWLQSDLKGNIESPAFYFSNAADAAEAADNLVLTQGWRRIRWEQVLQQQKNDPEYLAETEGHIINGKLVDKRNGLPVENITAYASVPAEKALFNSTVSGKNGQVRFNMNNFYGGNEIVLQTNSLTDSIYRIDISSPFSEKHSNRPVAEFTLSEKQAGLLAELSVQAQVGGTYYAEQQQRFLFPAALDTMPFYGIPDKRYYLDDYTRFITMEEVMREFIGDVRVRKNGDRFSFRVRNQAFDNFLETDPLILLDGIPVFNADKVIALDPLKIKRVDVVSQKFYQNKLVHDGIINYSSYTGDLAGYQLDANALIVEYGGLHLQREFYSPVYETAAQSGSRMPDFRNQLYWSPNILTGAGGSKQLSFYTGDIPGTYAVVVQGISASGLAGMQAITFTVTN